MSKVYIAGKISGDDDYGNNVHWGKKDKRIRNNKEKTE